MKMKNKIAVYLLIIIGVFCVSLIISCKKENTNSAPTVPATPTGYNAGLTDSTYSFSTTAADNEGDKIRYGWDWNNDENIDDWSDYVSSGVNIKCSHSWKSAGTYNIRVKAEDIKGAQSDWSDVKKIVIRGNNAPTTPVVPSGIDTGFASTSYKFTTSSTDADGDSIKYGWDLNGNDTVDEWSSFKVSGKTDSIIHTWSTPGIYSIKVKAQDKYGAQSAWSNVKKVKISGWSNSIVGSSIQNMNDIAIGKGRNDGITRIYGVSAEGHIYEFSYTGGAWSKVDIGNVSVSLEWISVGNGRNDGVMRLYVGKQYSNQGTAGVWEFSYNSGTWSQAQILNAWGVASITVGNGRNDGVSRLYLSNSYAANCREYSYNGAAWDNIDFFDAAVPRLFIGNGRNDGVMRIYETNALGGGGIKEATYNSTNWDYVTVVQTGSVLAIGDGRNDGVSRIYGTKSNIFSEYTYSSGVWNEFLYSDVTIPSNLVIGNGRNDGVMRIYAYASSTKYINEYTYSGGSWKSVDVGACGSRILVESGRNDGIIRLYGTSSNSIYEFTFQ
jgi:hypothetical protein